MNFSRMSNYLFDVLCITNDALTNRKGKSSLPTYFKEVVAITSKPAVGGSNCARSECDLQSRVVNVVFK